MSCRFFTCDNDYCDKTRSCDDMLEQFERDRKETIHHLKEGVDKIKNVLWSHNSPISKDENCLYKMGKELKLSIEDMLEKNCVSHTLFNYYVCPQCKNLRRLIDFAETGPNMPFPLQCGAHVGSLLYYEEISTIFPHLEISTSFSNFLGNTKLLFCDDFSKNFLINWYVTSHPSQGIENNIQKLYMSFICNSNVYNLYEYCDLNDIGIFQDKMDLLSDNGRPSPTSKPDDKTPLKKEVANGVIRQLVCLLHYLSKSNFSYEGFKLSNLKFKKVPVSYHYEGLHVSAPVTLKLTHLEKSSCDVSVSLGDISEQKYRICHKSVVESENFNKMLKKKKQKEKLGEIYRCADKTFKIPNKLKDKRLFMYMKNLGYLDYACSFDLYAFLVMLMTDRAFYSAVLSDKNLASLWRSLWPENSLDLITNRISVYHDQSKIPDTQDQVLELLSSIEMFTDGLATAFKALY